MTPVKHLIGTAVWLLAWTISAQAQTMYVAEIKDISIRSGPGSEYKTSGVVSTGQPVVFLETSGTWTKVQTPQGKEGWIQSRFLQKDALGESTSSSGSQRKNDPATPECSALASEHAQLKEKNKATESELAATKEAVRRAEAEYESLKKDSSGVVSLRNQLTESNEQLAKEKSHAEKCETEFSQLYNDQRMKWFFVGAGVMVVGFIIGFVARSSRKRTSFR